MLSESIEFSLDLLQTIPPLCLLKTVPREVQFEYHQLYETFILNANRNEEVERARDRCDQNTAMEKL